MAQAKTKTVGARKPAQKPAKVAKTASRTSKPKAAQTR